MGQNEARGLSFVNDFIRIFTIWVSGNTDSRKWATPWKHGLLSCEQLSQGAIPPSVWSALSSQPYHLGDAVGVPLTEHLHPKGPPLWLPGGGGGWAFFITVLIMLLGGSTSWKAVVTAPHLRQHRHLHMCCCCHSIYPDRHYYTRANKNPHFKPGTPCKFNAKSSCIHLKEYVPFYFIKTKTVWKFNITLITACKSALAPTVPSTN